MLEAKDSSNIENIVTTTDNLFKFLDNENKADTMTKEALKYSYALKKGYGVIQSGKPFTCSLGAQICGYLKGVEMDIRKNLGTVLINDKTREKNIHTSR